MTSGGTLAAVVGLGKIGLPLAIQFAGSGVATTGLDINQTLVDGLNEGISPFDFEPELETRLRECLARGTFRATTDPREALGEADFIVVVVPLVISEDKTPAFHALDAAARTVGSALKPGAHVIFETTVPVGTTRGRLVPILEEASGLKAGIDFGVAFSPERVSSGRIFGDLRRYPKLVGGIDAGSAKAVATFYESTLVFDPREDLKRPNGVWVLDSAEAAELAKLAETTYRDVNIALANEFAAYAEKIGVDVWQVIEAANSQPFSHIHHPGVAVGGHCIPVYPHLYLSTDPDARIPALARTVNKAQPGRALGRLAAEVGSLDGKTIAILGAAYRGNVKETAFSGVFDLVVEAKEMGAHPRVQDPMYTDDELAALGFEPHHLGEPCDLAVIQADHPEYRKLRPEDLPGCRALYDGRAIVDPEPWEGTSTSVLVVGR
ncbi:MAG TPA: nucleotide sugar dehydrogenase [Acidimicrobiia bacterium]